VVQRWRSTVFDGLVAAGVLALYAFNWPSVRLALVAVVMALALVVRRRYPLTVLGVVAAAALVQVLTAVSGSEGPLPFDAAIPIAMYSVVKYARTLRDGFIAAGVVVAGIAIEVRRLAALGSWWQVTLFYTAVFAGIWLSAYVVRTRRAHLSSLEERAATLERERQHLAEIAVAHERATIAREMHDVVAHSLAVIIVQADGGRYAMAASPATAAQVLETVAATARDALEEMRRLIDLLRSDSVATEDRQIRRIDDVPALVERARQAGLDMTLSLDPVPCSPTVGATVYRLVQEALTNVIRHAGPSARCAVTVWLDDGSLRLSIVDDGGADGGRSAPDPALADRVSTDRVGHGLVGMRERTAVLGGTFDAGPRADGGWRVHAVLPVGTP
jgi:signal transduction histidine kinase